jgi:hypothetical protein
MAGPVARRSGARRWPCVLLCSKLGRVPKRSRRTRAVARYESGVSAVFLGLSLDPVYRKARPLFWRSRAPARERSLRNSRSPGTVPSVALHSTHSRTSASRALTRSPATKPKRAPPTRTCSLGGKDADPTSHPPASQVGNRKISVAVRRTLCHGLQRRPLETRLGSLPTAKEVPPRPGSNGFLVGDFYQTTDDLEEIVGFRTPCNPASREISKLSQS